MSLSMLVTLLCSLRSYFLTLSQLGLRFAEFFEKLTDMMSILGGHLVYLSKYATGFMESREVQQVFLVLYIH